MRKQKKEALTMTIVGAFAFGEDDSFVWDGICARSVSDALGNAKFFAKA